MDKQIKLNQDILNNAIETFCEAYEKNVTQKKAQIYYDTLKYDFTDQEITSAIPIVLRKCRFFPSIADIVMAIEDGEGYSESSYVDLDKWSREHEK